MTLKPAHHAWKLADWLEDLTKVHTFPSPGEELWQMSVDWLRMAGGLSSVQIDLDPNGDAAMCADAWEYVDASSQGASAQQTELTRLLYVYAGLENIVRTCDPTVGNSGSIMPAIRRVFQTATLDTPWHYSTVVSHLESHISDNQTLWEKEKVRRTFTPYQGTSATIVGLQVGIQLRHLLAHGDFSVYTEPFDADDGWLPPEDAHVCTIRSATSAMLISMQALLEAYTQAGNINPEADPAWHHWQGAFERFWIPIRAPGQEWVMVETLRDYLMVLHLVPGDTPPEVERGQLTLGQQIEGEINP
ncbi:hypothetical protein AB0H37_05795 [Actinomadura sp. NPDC023710]|uniref:hypothetical protein n=1 Tax=Actinomadura sp. NPDC023710 TaxID=3158219 RepID=UPI0033FEFCEF